MRAKMKCSYVTNHDGGNETVKLFAVYGADGTANASWSKATPSGSVELTISNPEAKGHFTPGKEYFVDFHEAAE